MHVSNLYGSPQGEAFAQRIVDNSQALADGLLRRGATLVTGGTDNHLVLLDLRPKGINGSKVEKACERAGIAKVAFITEPPARGG